MLHGLLLTSFAAGHPYCGRAQAPTVPGVPTAEHVGLRLASTAVVIRHGARTPQDAFKCWPSYDPHAIAWQCEQPEREVALGGVDFDIFYGGSRMVLGARTHCAAGQLLDEGRAQARAVGAALREAYVGANATIAPLLPETLPRFGETGVALRSSTAERAIASGQELIVGLLTPSSPAPSGAAGKVRARADHPIRWEVAEFDTDWLFANPIACPRLDLIAAEADGAFAADGAASAEDERIRQEVIAEVGDGDLAALRGNPSLDCLMATACDASAEDAGTHLPTGLRGPLFERAWAAIQASDARLLLHANATWSKLAMARMLAELRSHAHGAVDGLLGRPKLALWAGHDSTVMPLLAALGVWDSRWAPYAANFVLEVWTPQHSGSAGSGDAQPGAAPRVPHVRLMYNSEVITHRLAGCEPNASLCPFAALESVIGPLALDEDEWRHACRPPAATPKLQQPAPSEPALAGVTKPGAPRAWAWLVAGTAMLVLVAAAADAVREGGPAASRRLFGRATLQLRDDEAARRAAGGAGTIAMPFDVSRARARGASVESGVREPLVHV